MNRLDEVEIYMFLLAPREYMYGYLSVLLPPMEIREDTGSRL